MEDNKMLNITPYNPSGYYILGKIIMGFIIGLIISFFIFIIFMLMGGLFETAMGGGNSTNPLLSIIILVIAFFGSLVGNIIIGTLYNLIFSDKYYDLGKILSTISAVNFLLFFIVSPIYIIFYNNISAIFFILALHIMFSVFISLSVVEFITNPNYSASHIIGTTLGLSISILIFAIFYKNTNINIGGEEILISIPPIISYSIIPLLHGVWEKVYYKFYEMGNNFLYIPSLDEILVEEEENDEINIEDK